MPDSSEHPVSPRFFVPHDLSPERDMALADILRERESIARKWEVPALTVSECFPPHARLPVLTEEIGEVAKAMQDGDRTELRDELTQVAAVALRWIECLYEIDAV